MDYQRITPRARQGTTGISEEYNLEKGGGIVIFPPDRVATLTIATHWAQNETAKFKVEVSFNRADNIAESLKDNPNAIVYWDNIYGQDENGNDLICTQQGSITITNTVTAVRVSHLDDNTTTATSINVCLVG